MSDLDKLTLKLKKLTERAKRWKGWRKVRAKLWGWLYKKADGKIDDLIKLK